MPSLLRVNHNTFRALINPSPAIPNGASLTFKIQPDAGLHARVHSDVESRDDINVSISRDIFAILCGEVKSVILARDYAKCRINASMAGLAIFVGKDKNLDVWICVSEVGKPDFKFVFEIADWFEFQHVAQRPMQIPQY